MDVDALEATIERMEADIHQTTHDFHRVERWRDRLLDENSEQVLTEFMHAYPAANCSQIRQYIRNSKLELRNT